jgi:hypothetical protein
MEVCGSPLVSVVTGAQLAQDSWPFVSAEATTRDPKSKPIKLASDAHGLLKANSRNVKPV